MFERKLMRLLGKAKLLRQQAFENKTASYCHDTFCNLSDFILKNLCSLLFRNRNVRIIVNHFDEILQYIVMSNIDILSLNINLFIKQPNFKEKFVVGLKKYPYPDGVEQLFDNIWNYIDDEQNKFDEFIDDDILKILSTMNLSMDFYLSFLNRINETNQRKFLNLLVENKHDIPYSLIEYKGDNRQVIYKNLTLIMRNSKNLYSLMDFVKYNPIALLQVKNYIDNNEEQAINSIFCKTGYLLKINEPMLREIIKLIILDVMKNEKVKFSDITYNSGGFSRVLLIGDKVIKLGNRITKSFSNNPYIVAPLLRKEFNVNGEKCFVEVTERVDTSIKPSKEELYQLFKHLCNLGLKWTDIKASNVGRLNRKNIIHWQDNLYPSEDVLGLGTKRGIKILEEGDFVILDADFIYDENDPNINYANNKPLYDEFEKRYQSEKKRLKEQEENFKIIDSSVSFYDIDEQRGMNR